MKVISRDRSLHKVVKQSHQDAANQSQGDSLGDFALFAFDSLVVAIGKRVQDNRRRDQGNPGEYQNRIPLGLCNVVDDDAFNQGDSNSNGDPPAQAGDMDRRGEKDVGEVKDKSTKDRPLEATQTPLS